MIRGTTPTLEFTLPFEVSNLSTAYITLAQNGRIVVEKCMDECKCGKDILSVQLTQEETLKLDCNYKVDIQIRAKTVMDEALASNIITVSARKILKDGVI